MYDRLARHYDLFMQEVDYNKWSDYVAGFLPAAPCSGMDVGCGTGRSTLELIAKGYGVIGSDLSPEMLGKARENAKKAGVNAQFVLQSAENITTHRPLDFITAQCDVVNYLSAPKRFFSAANKALRKGGALVFDVSSEYKLTNVLGNNVFTDETDDVTYIWENSLNKRRTAVDMRLTFFSKNGSGAYEKSVEEQTQYVHKTDDLLSALSACGYKARAYGFMTSRAVKANDERVLIVAVKE